MVDANRGSGAPLFAVIGPTASGKTALAVALALRLGGELINADSRQAIAELRVATWKPGEADLRGVPICGLDWRHLGADYSVAEFAARAAVAVNEIRSRGKLPILVGGSGLYVRALLEGFDFGRTAPGRRTERRTSELALELAAVDRAIATRVDLANPRRLQRAIELAHAKAFPGRKPTAGGLRVALEVDPARLRARIADRSERILGEPIRAEIAKLKSDGFSRESVTSAAIGYAEAWAWVEGECSRDQAVASVRRRTWRYARAQRTWLRTEPGVEWVDGSLELEEQVRLAETLLQSRQGGTE